MSNENDKEQLIYNAITKIVNDSKQPNSEFHKIGDMILGLIKSDLVRQYHLPKTKSVDELRKEFYNFSDTSIKKVFDFFLPYLQQNNEECQMIDWTKDQFLIVKSQLNKTSDKKSDVWLNINDEQPIYYTPFLCQLTSLDYVVLWRANNGSYDVYTVNKGDTVYLSKDILKWKKLESPNPKP